MPSPLALGSLGVSLLGFRDPSTAWLGGDGLWRFAVAGVGSTLVYRSADFVRWDRNATPLHASPDVPTRERLDLFPVAERGTEGPLDTSTATGPGVRHVLKLSNMADEDYYMVGWYDDAADTFAPTEEERGSDVRKWRRIDHGYLFDAKSFFHARKRRRMLWAWVDEPDGHSHAVANAKGWAGIQVFPRALWLHTDGKQLVHWLVEEIETLRRRRVALLGAEVEVVFEIPNLEAAEKFDPKWLQDSEKLCAENDGVGPFGTARE